MNAALKLPEIENDLRNLCIEYGKLYNDIKISIEHAILHLRLLYTNPININNHNIALNILSNDIIYRPLLQCINTKNIKLIFISLPIIQKLLKLDAITSDILSSLIGTLRILIELNDENLLLKILQTLLLAISPIRIAIIEETALSQSLSICFKLANNNSHVVSNTANATLRQVVTLLYDRVVLPEDNSIKKSFTAEIPKYATMPSDLDKLTREAKSAYLMFQDLCILCSGDNSMYDTLWLKLPYLLPMNVGLELMETILQNHVKLFSSYPFKEILQIQVCPLVIKLMNDRISNFPTLVRLMRIVLVLIKEYHTILIPNCEILISILVKLISHEKSMGANTLALEVIRSLTIHSDLFFYLFCMYDEALLETMPLNDSSSNKEYDPLNRSRTKLIGVLFHALSNFIVSHQVRLDDEIDEFNRVQSKAMLLLLKWQHHHKSKYLDSLSEKENTIIFEDLYAISLAIDALLFIVQSLSSIINHNTLKSHTSIEPLITEDEECRMIYIDSHHIPLKLLSDYASMISVPLLTMFNLLLVRSEEESQVQHFLTNFQSFTNCCGMLYLNDPRNAFISFLCKLSVPANWSSGAMLVGKNIQAYKAVFNIAQCLEGSFDIYSWDIILNCLNELNDYLIKHNSRSAAGSVAICHSISDEELQILSGAMNRLFENSITHNRENILELLNSLTSLSLSIIADSSMDTENFTESLKAIPSWIPSLLPQSNSDSIFSMTTCHQVAMNPSYFYLTRFVHVVEQNISRVPAIWDLSVNHLTALATHRNPLLRMFAIDVLNKVIVKLMNLNEEDKVSYWKEVESGQTENNNINHLKLANFQSMLFSPLIDWMLAKYDDLREKVVGSISYLLQHCGSQLKEAWSIVINLLAPLSKSNELSSIQTGFKCVQLIINDFLYNLPDSSLCDLVACVSSFALQRKDANMSFSSIGFLRDISSYLTKLSNGDNVDNCKIYKDSQLTVLIALKDLSTDSRTEVRNAAIQTLFSSILNSQSTSLPNKIDVSEERASLIEYVKYHYIELRGINVDSADAQLQAQLEVWKSIWTVVVWPLIQEVFDPTSSTQKTSESAADVELGIDKSTGKAVKMMAHHSRATAEKQWDESLVHMLQGLSRLYKSAMWWVQLSSEESNGFSAYINLSVESITDCSQEVSMAAVHGLSDVVLSSLTPTLINCYPYLWGEFVVSASKLKKLSDLLPTDGSNALSSRAKEGRFDLLALIVTFFNTTVAKLGVYFKSYDLMLFLETSNSFGDAFLTSVDANIALSGRYRTSNLQITLLQFLEDFVSNPVVVDKPQLTSAALKYLLSSTLSGFHKNTTKSFILPKFAESSLKLFSTLFKNKICPEARAILIDNICNFYLDIYLLRFPRSSSLSVSLHLEVFELLQSGLQSVSNSRDFTFESLYNLCSVILSPKFGPAANLTAELCEDYFCEFNLKTEYTTCGDFQINFVNLFTYTILPATQNYSLETQNQFLNLLNILSFKVKLNTNLSYLKTVVQGLFNLCSVQILDTSVPDLYSIKLAKLGYPILLEFTTSYLINYIIETSSDSPGDEFSIFLLKLILESDISPQISESDFLTKLYPILCDCILHRNNEIANMLKLIFHKIGKKLKLM